MEEFDGGLFVAVGLASSTLRVYTFDGASLELRQHLNVTGSLALDMASVADDAFYLATVTAGVDSGATLWKWNDRRLAFAPLQRLDAVGAVDVLFTVDAASVYLTFGVDPSPLWSQYSLPAEVSVQPTIRTNSDSVQLDFRFAQVYRRRAGSDEFDEFMKLDMDRVVSLTNLEILGNDRFFPASSRTSLTTLPFFVVQGTTHLVAASRSGQVGVYRLVAGQGFQTEQTFQLSGVRAVQAYSIGDESYVAAVTDAGLQTFAARVRGLTKPHALV